MNQFHFFLKKAQTALKTVFTVRGTEQKVPDNTAVPEKKKEMSSLPVISNAIGFQKKRLKKNTPVIKKETDWLHVSMVEKSAFAAFQQNYTGKTKPFAISSAGYYGQPQKLMITVRSGLRPLPPGMVTMLDLCYNSIQSSLI